MESDLRVKVLLLLIVIEFRLLMAQFSTDVLYKEVNFNSLDLNRAENFWVEFQERERETADER